MIRRCHRFICGILCLVICVSFCWLAPVSACAELSIPKILTQLSYTPVALMDVTTIVATTTTDGCYIDYYAWFTQADGQIVADKFGTDTVYVEMTLRTYDGYRFTDDVAAYINNNKVEATVFDDGTAVTITRVYAPDVWTPSVVKHPGGETVDENGSCSFVSTATYTVGYKWFIVAPDGTTVFEAADVPAYYDGASASGYDTERLNLHHVTAEMDGCRVYCQFAGMGDTYANSHEASLKVKYDPKPSETPEPTPTPTPTPTAAPSATPVPSATPLPTETPHVHEFSSAWQSDETYHWHECSCGQKTDIESHSMVWTETKAATRTEEGEQEGICTVCGYSTIAPVAYKSAGIFRYVAIALIALSLIAVIVLVIELIKSAQRKKRRRKLKAAKARARAKAKREEELRSRRDNDNDPEG